MDDQSISMSKGSLRLGLFVLAGLVLQAGASAADLARTLQKIHPYVATGMTWDTNLFRVEDNDQAKLLLGTRSKNDRYLTLETGFDTELAVSRQRFLLDGRIHRDKYNRFDELDYTGGDARALWKWVRGKLWSGDLGYKYRRSLRSFANQTVPKKDIREEHRVFGKADRWLTDRWRAGVLGNWSEVDFDETDTLKRSRGEGGVGIDYVTQAGNSVGFQSTYTNADFDNARSNDYSQYQLGPRMDWRPTGKTRIQAKAGYTNRSFDDNSSPRGQKDYDGFTGRLTAIVSAAESRRIEASVYREISNLGDEISNYAVIHGVSLEPVWQVTGKIALRALGEYEQRDFKGDRGRSTLDLDQREDDVYTAGIWLDWRPYRIITASIGYQAGKRDSNRDFEEYNYESVEARLTAGF
jgi:exopolysaccharide biosynthesis operon protein EpsL